MRHPSDAELVRLSARIPPAGRFHFAKHLQHCPSCEARIRELQLLRSVHAFHHATREGEVVLSLERQDARWMSAINGESVQAGRGHRNAATALAWLLGAFRELFPEHRCNGHCGSGKPGGAGLPVALPYAEPNREAPPQPT